jgi:acylphosphatase
LTEVTVRIIISGKVQGVSFRALLKEHALLNELDGWVRNRYDDSLEALLQGEEVNVRTVIEWARHGPPGARVDSLVEQKLSRYWEKLGFEILE